MTDRASNVIEALARVREELPGIGKDGTADPKQGGYHYRSIEGILAPLGPLLGEHGVVFIPQVLKHEITQIEVAQKPWTDTKLEVLYAVMGPGGPEDKVTAGPVIGIGRDNSDKGANKAMSQAFKQVLLQVFAIGDNQTDPDSATHEADARQEALPDQWLRDNGWADGKVAHDAYRAESLAIRNSLNDEQRERFRVWAQGEGVAFNRENTRAEAEAMRRVLEALRDEKPEQIIAPEDGQLVDVEHPPHVDMSDVDRTPVSVPDEDPEF